MVDATITRGSGNFLSSGSSVLTLPNITTESIKKSAQLIRVPFPMADSYNSIMADLLGCSRDITVSGSAYVDDISGGDIYKFARDLASIKTKNPQTLITGDQSDTGGSQVGFVYNSVVLNMSSTGQLTGTLAETMTVYVNDSQLTFNGGDVNTVTFSLTMYEGSKTNSF